MGGQKMEKLTPETLQLFLLFVVPGFVALKTYKLFVPGERLEAGAALMDAVVYSMVNYAIMWWPIYILTRPGFADHHHRWFVTGTFAVLLIAPAGLAWALYRFRASEWASARFQHPIPMAWDYFFALKRPCFMLFHLKSGERIGGFFGKKSFVSSFPEEPDVYIEEVWRVDENGLFLERPPGTAGILIRFAECEMIELFEANEGQPEVIDE
jgi:hypothetical protein